LSFISHPLKVDDLSYVAVGVLFISFIPFRYFEKEAYITDNGIETGRDYIRWVQIESYQWPASDEEVIQVFFKTSRRLPIINFVQLDVPYEMKDAVDETLLRKVLHVPATPEVHA
jgi:hypothetical protein